ncbi:BTAD domain-containing putative transcriptional regulator [Cellulomonas sp.]|uniref:nSTAND1 domain-containing NTPase n=1 Tax=Cellulomonas sp. TaxID=40001 RepID=UPI003BAA0F5A
MGIQVLGPLTVGGADGYATRDRVVLEVLVVRANEAVDTEVLADALWAEDPPTSWPKVVQGCISRLRKQLGADAIHTTSRGAYVLRVTEDQIDSHRFERMLARARDHLADHDPDRASYVLTEALALWRGRALSDLDEWEPGRTEAERLDGLRMDAQELRVEAEIAAGRARATLDDARALVREAPFRERRWALFARALYQSGRQSEALDVLGRARRMLQAELGLDPGPELQTLEEAILRQDPGLEGTESLTTSLVCPYRGLLPYGSEDAETFFGREADAEACLSRLRARGVLAVVGPSGIGKSSLVRAGVVAALRDGGARVLVTTPGTRPLDSLAALPSRPSFPVLVVDQGEEAVTLCTDPIERAAYLDRLAEFDGPVVLALRADRLGELSTHRGFARLVEGGLYLLSPMSEDNLRAAIEGPARQSGLRVEPGLVDLLVREVEGEPGALPLLSHALRQTWERREGPTLTVEGYRATGGIRDAVAQSAEALFSQFDDQQQAQVRSLFLRLVTPSDDGAPIRSRVPRQRLALDESHERLVELLAGARLVSTDEGDVQIAHEALAREWPRLLGWLEDDVEGQRVLRHLTAAAEGWDGMGRPESELYRGVRLAGATEWADRHDVELTGTELAFLDASRAHADRELRSKARINRRLRISLASVGVLLVAALAAGVAAIDAAHQSDDDARVADSRRLSAEALTTVEPDLAVLLGLQAVRLDDTPATRSALSEVLGTTGDLVAVDRGSGFDFVDVSPDGRSVAVTSAYGTDVQGQTTFDAETLVMTRARPDLRTAALAYSPDGRNLVVAVSAFAPSTNGEVVPHPHPLRVLDVPSLAEVGTYDGFAEGSYVERDGLAFSADGSRLAAVAWLDSDPLEALVWDTDDPTRPILRVPMPEIYGLVQLSPDGDTLYVAQRAGRESLRAIDVDTGTLLRSSTPEWGGERGGIIALSPDGSTLARSDVDGLVILDAATFVSRFTLAGVSGGVSALTFGPDGTLLAAGYADGVIVVWDLAGRKPAHTFRGHAKEISDLAVNPRGDTLYSVAPDRLLLAWDLLGTRGFPGWRSFPEQPTWTEMHASTPSPDGTKVLYAGYTSEAGDQSLQIRDLTTGDLTPAMNLERLNQFLWSPDSSVVLTAGAHPDGTSFWIQTWDPRTAAPLRRNDSTGVKWLTYTPDGTALVALEGDTSITTVDPATLEVDGPSIELPALGAERWFPPLLNPDGRTVVLQRWISSTTAVVDLTAGTVRDVTFPSYPFAMAFSPDGAGLAVYYDDGTWGVLDVAALRDGRLEYRLDVRAYPSNAIWEMTYSADGDHIVTSGSGVVELWDARTLERLTSLGVDSQDDVATARLLTDGHTLLLAHPQGQVLTWDTRPQHLLDLACSLAGRNLTQEEWDRYLLHREYDPACPDGVGTVPARAVERPRG